MITLQCGYVPVDTINPKIKVLVKDTILVRELQYSPRVSRRFANVWDICARTFFVCVLDLNPDIVHFEILA